MNQLTPTQHAGDRWTGTRLEGQRWTEQRKTQMMLARGHLDRWDSRWVAIRIPREPTAEDRACCRPRDMCFDEAKVECPILAKGMNQDTVITPGGDRVAVKR